MVFELISDRKKIAILATLTGVGLLAGAYIFQYGFGYAPCDLCWYQRYPYFIVLGVGALAVAFRLFDRLWYLVGVTALLAVDAGIAAYHAGVEQKWWKGPETCTSQLGSAGSAEDLLASLQNTKLVLCDDIVWDLFDITMAGYNFLIAGAMVLICLYALIKGKSA